MTRARGWPAVLAAGLRCSRSVDGAGGPVDRVGGPADRVRGRSTVLAAQSTARSTVFAVGRRWEPTELTSRVVHCEPVTKNPAEG
jgi:hypothetical protein